MATRPILVEWGQHRQQPGHEFCPLDLEAVEIVCLADVFPPTADDRLPTMAGSGDDAREGGEEGSGR